MSLKIADSIVNGKAVTFSELSYGKREHASYVPFQIHADNSEWENDFKVIYDDLLEELKSDDRKVGEFNPPYTGATRYPSYKELMNLPRLSRMEFINTFLVFDILKLFLFEDDREKTADWIISEVTDVVLKEHSLIISGYVSRLR